MSPTDVDNLTSAKAQHLIALRLRRTILTSGATIQAAAEEHGMDKNQLGRILRGDVIMRLEHIAWADRSFGLGILRALVQPG